MSQLELSKLADLNRTYLSLLERGHRSPSLNTINKISSVLAINISDFMNLVEKNSDGGEEISRAELTATAFENADMGIWSYDFRTDKINHDDWWTEHLGYIPGDPTFTYESLKTRVHPDDLKKVEEALDHHLKGETSCFEVYYRIQNKNEIWKPVWCRGKIGLRDKFGRAINMSGVHLDLSQEDLQFLENKELEISNRNVAHEINNILFIIKANIEVLRRRGPDESFNRRLQQMEDSVERISKVVRFKKKVC